MTVPRPFRRSVNHELVLRTPEGRLKVHVSWSFHEGRLVEVAIDNDTKTSNERAAGLNYLGRVMTKALRAGVPWDDLEPPAESGSTRGVAQIGGLEVRVGSIREAVWLLVKREID